MKPARAALLPCLALTACVPKPEGGSERPPLDTACYAPGAHFALLATDTKVYRQGAVVRVTPMVDKSPFGTAELPLKCTSGWSVSGPAKLSADRKSVAIAPDAPVGATVTIGFRHIGRPAETRFKIVAKDEVVLTGATASAASKAAPRPNRSASSSFGRRTDFRSPSFRSKPTGIIGAATPGIPPRSNSG